jgi:hypothetical protein
MYHAKVLGAVGAEPFVSCDDYDAIMSFVIDLCGVPDTANTYSKDGDIMTTLCYASYAVIVYSL